MSVFPQFLVLGKDGKIGAYSREDILKVDLAQNFKDGSPARAIFKLEPSSMMVSYSLTRDYDQWVELDSLYSEALKGICVYCGEVQQYESLEQKSGEAGNQIRVDHIRRCTQRPELKLIAYCEKLQEAANAAFKCLQGTGDKTIAQVKDQLFAVLNPKRPRRETKP